MKSYLFALLAGAVLVAGYAPTAAAQEAPDDAAQQFEEKFTAWKDVLEQLRQVRVEYQVAGESEREALRRKWEGLIEKGQTMTPQLRTTGLAAYKADPNADRELTRFLIKLAADDVNRDAYEPAEKVVRALVENDCEFGVAYTLGGVTAFATNQFDRAEELFQQAEEKGAIGELGSEWEQIIAGWRGVIGNYKQYWEREEKLREEEAEADDLPRVKFETTAGDIVLELFENQAPETVGNFVSLVEDGFYDGAPFHRVLPHFMAQGGDPTGTGTGGPGYTIYCECYEDDARMHFRGSLSMAHAGRDTGGSQFFLTFVPTPHLNNKHTVFGRVVEGLDVLSQIKRVDPQQPGGAEPTKIEKAEVLRKRDHPYAPNKVQ